jgi:hypothetical protein
MSRSAPLMDHCWIRRVVFIPAAPAYWERLLLSRVSQFPFAPYDPHGGLTTLVPGIEESVCIPSFQGLTRSEGVIN